MSKKSLILTATLMIFAAIGAVLLTTQTPLLAQDNLPAPIQRTINVSGVGIVTAVPDVLRATIGVESENANLSEALAENNNRMTAVLAKLTELGVEDKDIQTSNFFISERRDRDGNITGFFVNNNVNVTLRNLDTAGTILDEVIQAGANRVNGIQLAISDTTELLSQARALAVEDAQAKAKEFTDAAGMFLGNPITISEAGGFQGGNARVAVAEATADFSIPISAGESAVTVNVSITYAIF